MSLLIIDLNLQPLSYNAYYRNSHSGNRIKTGAGLAYDEELEYLLNNYSDELKNFGKSLDPSKNIVSMGIKYYNPGMLLKDKSRLSKTAGDLDNIIKVLQDKLFKLICEDDSIVRRLKDIYDVPSDEYGIRITLGIEPIPDFCPNDLGSLDS